MSRRFLLTVLIITIVAFFAVIIVPQANASYGGGGSSPSNPSCSGSCSGSGGGGNATWYELLGTNSNFANGGAVPPAYTWGSPARRSLTRAQLAKRLTRDFMWPCSKKRGKGCVLWTDKSFATPLCSGNCKSWWELHTKRIYDAATGSPERAGGGFNVRVWRENTRTNKMELIFERRVGAACGKNCNNFNTDRNGYSGQIEANKMWWFGSPGKKQGTGNKKPGGEYWEQGAKAGMLGQWYSGGGKSSQCTSRYRGRYNDGKMNSLIAIGQNKTLRLPGDSAKGKVRYLKKETPYWPDTKLLRHNDASDLGPKYQHHCYWNANTQLDNKKKFTWSNAGQAISEEFGREDFEGSLKNDQWGIAADKSLYRLPGRSGTYNVSPNFGGVLGTGLKEAIAVSWNLPDVGRANINVQIQGAPGLIYAMHITRVDNREKIMPLTSNNLNWKKDYRSTFWPGWCGANAKTYCSATEKQAASSDSQIFKAFIDTPLPATGLPEDPPREDPYTVSPPDVDVSLEVDEVVSVMEPSDQTVEANLITSYSPAAIFPTGAEVNHFTPQRRHNSGANAYQEHATYNRSGVNWFASDEHVSKKSGDSGIRTADLLSRQFNADIDEINPIVPSGSTSPGVGSSYGYSLETTWSNPTPINPCSPHYGSGSNLGGDPFGHDNDYLWPSSPRIPASSAPADCQGVYNVWDELFYGTASWQSIWETGKYRANVLDTVNHDTLDIIPLRCNPYSSPASGALTSCPDPFLPPANSVTGMINQSIGQPYTRARAIVEPNSAIAGSSVTGATATVQPVPDAGVSVPPVVVSDTYNLLTGKNEVNLCRQGQPVGSRGSAPFADLGCAGYTMRWVWERREDFKRCSAQTPSGPAVPSLESLIANPDNYSTAGDYETWRLAKAQAVMDQMGSYRQAGLISGASGGDPYSDELPSERAGWIPCGDDRWLQTGRWEVDYVNSVDWQNAHAGFGKNNDGPRLPVTGPRVTLITFDLPSLQSVKLSASWNSPNRKLSYLNDSDTDRAPVQVLAPAPTR